MTDCWAEIVVVARADLRAGWMAVKLVGSMAENWIDKMAGLRTVCWAEKMTVTRAGSGVG